MCSRYTTRDYFSLAAAVCADIYCSGLVRLFLQRLEKTHCTECDLAAEVCEGTQDTV